MNSKVKPHSTAWNIARKVYFNTNDFLPKTIECSYAEAVKIRNALSKLKRAFKGKQFRTRIIKKGIMIQQIVRINEVIKELISVYDRDRYGVPNGEFDQIITKLKQYVKNRKK